jgi:hypothetical protein
VELPASCLPVVGSEDLPLRREKLYIYIFALIRCKRPSLFALCVGNESGAAQCRFMSYFCFCICCWTQGSGIQLGKNFGPNRNGRISVNLGRISVRFRNHYRNIRILMP